MKKTILLLLILSLNAFSVIGPFPGQQGSGGVGSINGDTTSAQIITGGAGINVSTLAGTTTITNTGASVAGVVGTGTAGQVAVWSAPTTITGSNSLTLTSLTSPLVQGGTTAAANLSLRSTSHPTKGMVIIDDGSTLVSSRDPSNPITNAISDYEAVSFLTTQTAAILNSGGNAAGLILAGGGGTFASPSYLTNGQEIGSIFFSASDNATTDANTVGGIFMTASQTQSAGNLGSKMSLQTTLNGSSSPTDRLVIDSSNIALTSTNITLTGNLMFSPDATYTIGSASAGGTTRPSRGFFQSSVSSGSVGTTFNYNLASNGSIGDDNGDSHGPASWKFNGNTKAMTARVDNSNILTLSTRRDSGPFTQANLLGSSTNLIWTNDGDSNIGVDWDGTTMMRPKLAYIKQQVIVPSVSLQGTTSGAVTVNGGNTVSSYSVTLPSAQGTGSLNNDGSGNLSWGSSFTGSSVTLGANPNPTMVTINGGVIHTTRTVGSSLAIDTGGSTDYIIAANTTATPFTVSLPTAANGRTLIIKDVGGVCGTNPVTIKPKSGVSIEGLSSNYLLQNNNGVVRLFSDGTNWWIW